MPTATDRPGLLSTAAHVPALTVMVFFRSRIGHALLRPTYLAPAFLCLLLVAFLNTIANPLVKTVTGGNVTYQGTAFVPLIFAGAFLLMAVYQRNWAKARLFGALERRWHPDHRGLSRLVYLMPAMEMNRLQRFAEPAICLILSGVTTMFVSWALGMWFAWAGMCLLFSESVVYQNSMEALENQTRAGIESLWLADDEAMLRYLETAPPAAKQHLTGIPGGLTAELMRNMAKNGLLTPDPQAEGHPPR